MPSCRSPTACSPTRSPPSRWPCSRSHFAAAGRAGPGRAGTVPAVAVLAQIGLGIGIVLTGDTGRAHEILRGAHEAGAGLVWGLLVALASVSRPRDRERARLLSVLRPRAWRAAAATPAAQPEP